MLCMYNRTKTNNILKRPSHQGRLKRYIKILNENVNPTWRCYIYEGLIYIGCLVD